MPCGNELFSLVTTRSPRADVGTVPGSAGQTVLPVPAVGRS